MDPILGYEVKTLDASKGNSFTWSKETEIHYKENKVLAKVNPPGLFNSRGALKLSEEDFAKYKSFL